MHRSNHIGLSLLLVAVLVAAACGTRLSDEEFNRIAGAGEDGGDAGVALDGVPSGPSGPGPGMPGDTGGSAGSSEADTGGDARARDTGDGAVDGGGLSGRGAGGSTPAAGQQGSAGGEDSRAENTASDVGVTPSEIRVGIIASRGGPLGPDVFTPTYYGANAFFELLNARGGVNGRLVRVLYCDDAEDPGRNEECVHRLIDDEKVFAMVATSTRAYSGADYVSGKGVPDVGGQPIGNEYWTYPTFFTIRGSEFPRNGQVGWKGKVYHQTLQFRFLEQHAGISRAAVIHYNVPQSQTYASFLMRALRTEGIEAQAYEVNVAFPNFDAVVADMRATGVDAIWDVMDATGNQNLCQAMQRAAFSVKAKVTTTNGWSRDVRQRMAPICRRSLFGVSESRPNADTSHPAVAEFRRTMTQVYSGERDDALHQWALEGWAAARLFTDAVRAQGANVTRAGVIEWLNQQRDYTAGGLLTPVAWRPVNFDSTEAGRECLVVARWDDERANFVAVTPVPFCEDNIPYVGYTPS